MLPLTLESTQLIGFRAYLREQGVSFCSNGRPLSVAVFAANAKGKSSLVDAFEFYFSENATLPRLGIRSIDGQAGREALEHADARALGLDSSVQFSFREGTEPFGDTRSVSPGGTPRSEAANRVMEHCPIPFIIRGHQLRGFVEGQSAEKRYEEVINWFGLGPLLSTQKNLRALRKQLKQRAESRTAFAERMRDLPRLTANGVKDWQETKVLEWLNAEVLQKLDNTLFFSELSKDDLKYEDLVQRKQAEELNLGLVSINQLISTLESVDKATPPEEKPTANVTAFENAIVKFRDAATQEEAERASASKSVFNQVWAAAKDIFANQTISLQECPVCETALPQTALKSPDAILLRLDTKLTGINSYRRAVQAATAAAAELNKTHGLFLTNLEDLNSKLEDTGYGHRARRISDYRDQIKAWRIGHPAPDKSAAIAEHKVLLEELLQDRQRILREKGDQTYERALTIANSLIDFKSALARIDRVQSELSDLNDELKKEAEYINHRIAGHVQALIGALEERINEFYRDIQGDTAAVPRIHLEMPSEDDTNQQRLQLLIDFAHNRKGVAPSGYLSDSQLHALALSIRLAAIVTFNLTARIAILDDIVTSYDADHRKNIAAMFAKRLSHFQILLVTHDERFFNILQEHLPASCWKFRRITELKADFGPIFHDHRTADQDIDEKLERGESAANEIRQAEEEWLLDLCRDIRTSLPIRPLEHPYRFERSELALSLASFLRKQNISPPAVPGISNSFLASLQRGDIENFGSHFSDNPLETGSIGDERARWNEFKYFRSLFRCPSCGGTRFKRPDQLNKPVCKKCDTTFAFSISSAAIPVRAPAQTSPGHAA